LQPLALPGTSLEWLLDTVANSAEDSSQRKLLSTLVSYHWHKRSFLPGALVVMPLLGRRVILQVLAFWLHGAIVLLFPVASICPVCIKDIKFA
jgi:hypothetical protein